MDNVLMLVVERKSYAEVLAAGFNPALLHPDVAGNIVCGVAFTRVTSSVSHQLGR
jgi:hypothetical protein